MRERIEKVLDDYESGKIKQDGNKSASYIALERIRDIIWD